MGDAYRELMELFPAASRTWLRRNAHHGVAVISNHLLDHPHAVPHTRGEDTEDEQEAPQQQPVPAPRERDNARVAPRAVPQSSSDDEMEDDGGRVGRDDTPYVVRHRGWPGINIGPLDLIRFEGDSSSDDSVAGVEEEIDVGVPGQQPQRVRARGPRGARAEAGAANDDSSDDEDRELIQMIQQRLDERAAAAAENDDSSEDEDDRELIQLLQQQVDERAAAAARDDEEIVEQPQQPAQRAARRTQPRVRRHTADPQEAAAHAAAVQQQPPRKQQKMQQPKQAVAGGEKKNGKQKAAAKKQPKAAARVVAAPPKQEEEEPFVMRPIETGERCSGDCGKKPKVARIFCRGTGKKEHALCIACVEARHDRNLLRLSGPARYTCVMRNCYNAIERRELDSVAQQYAPAFYNKLQQMQPVQPPPLPPPTPKRVQQPVVLVQDPDDETDDEPENREPPSTPLGSQKTGVVPTTMKTPRVARRLSQRTLRPSLDSIDEADVQTAVAVEEADEEEPEASDEQEAELKALAAYVDREKLIKLEKYFPETAVGWLVRHADYGMDTLIEMVTSGQADVKQRRRADGRGATSIVEASLGARKQFECSVCFCDYDEHLAITCVWLEKRRRTIGPDEAAPDAAQLAADKEAETKGRREKHMFCAECVSGHARAAVEQNVILEAGVGVKCMQPGCKNALLRAHIDQVLDIKTRAILDPLFTNEALLAANCEDVEKCQRCPFAAVMLDPKETQRVFRCGNMNCRHAHCRLCGRSWDKVHKNRTCEELDPEAMRKRVEEELTAAAMGKCPRCKKGIVKTEGCNKITCPCGQLSCYVCKAAIKDYTHFKNGPAEEHLDKCPLWKDPNVEIEKKRKALLEEQIKGAADEATRAQLRGLN